MWKTFFSNRSDGPINGSTVTTLSERRCPKSGERRDDPTEDVRDDHDHTSGIVALRFIVTVLRMQSPILTSDMKLRGRGLEAGQSRSHG